MVEKSGVLEAAQNEECPWARAALSVERVSVARR